MLPVPACPHWRGRRRSSGIVSTSESGIIPRGACNLQARSKAGAVFFEAEKDAGRLKPGLSGTPCLSPARARGRKMAPSAVSRPSQLGLSDNVNFVLSLRTPMELCTRKHMESAPIPSTAGFFWPSLTLLFSLVAGASCVVVLAYALLLVVEF